VTYDEPLHHEYGNRILAWYGSGFRDQRVLAFKELHLYGGLFDLCAQWLIRLLPWDPYQSRHLLVALVSVLGVVGTARLAARVGGAWAGFWAGFLLALTPAWVGHGLFNPKDVPFGVAAVFATDAALRLAQGASPSRWRDTVWAGITLGIALGVRPAGVFLVAYPLFASTARAVLEVSRRARAQQPLRVPTESAAWLARVAVLITVAWAVMLIGWPWAQLSPIARPLQAVHAFAHFASQGGVLFGGALVDSRALPWSYLPTWFAISLPELYLVPLSCALVWLGLVLRARRVSLERALGVGVIALSVLLPLGTALVLRPVLYDAQRHFLFLYPPLAALSGLALAAVLHAPQLAMRLKLGVVATALALAGWVALDMVALHPYEYVYFNPSSGGLRDAVGRYEIDYWGASYKEALAWVIAQAPELGQRRPLRVTACDDNANERLQYYVDHWPGAAAGVRVACDYADADLFLAVRRDPGRENPGKVLHEIRRQQAPLLYVIRTAQP
jgi:hypothetical protein